MFADRSVAIALTANRIVCYEEVSRTATSARLMMTRDMR